MLRICRQMLLLETLPPAMLIRQRHANAPYHAVVVEPPIPI